MFILSSIPSSLAFGSVNHSSKYEKSELNVFKNIKFFGEISNNWQTIYQEKMYTRLLNLADNHYCSGLILFQKFLSKAHCHYFNPELCYF